MGWTRSAISLPSVLAVLAIAVPTIADTLPAERSAIERDWRMQDGIQTPRLQSTYAAAVQRLLDRGDRLLADLQGACVPLEAEAAEWAQVHSQWKQLSAAAGADQAQWEDLWRRAHLLRRRIALANPLAKFGPVAFIKQVPSVFSHQLTQYYGSCARPGGGVFVLERPGQTMQCRQLAAGALPLGSFQHLDVSSDGRRILFAYCHAETTPKDREEHLERYYHLYELDVGQVSNLPESASVAADPAGSRQAGNLPRGLRQLTDGAFDDFAPRYLPDGKIVFISTRRQGFHRCGRGPCPVYTLAVCEGDGSRPRVISYHETHEWDPAVLHDGRIIYTRWDYVDRDAVHFQQLWTVRPDGRDVRIFYGNYTLNPVGVWEARPVPGSRKVMATAAAHHAMTAGSIILLDVTRGADGQGPITRLTPDALFPESEATVLPGWRSPGDGTKPPDAPEAARWPGHCYRSPYPLSEKYFLAAYSFDSLIGEPSPNPKNMFGIYLVDAWGNKELLYRDPEICSLWPMPLRARARPTEVASVLGDVGLQADTPLAPNVSPHQKGASGEGTFLLQNVYQGWPSMPKEKIPRLRVVQVLPKSTWHANDPTVGLANASPGRQVLGTVPVEADGSAWFRAPAGIALAFQALDERGQAVQTMRSLTYLQPGENAGCIGCHEPRTAAPSRGLLPLALRRPPSVIQPGPDGSKPFSYPLLVQPVLDRKCVSCHGREKPAGGISLTGEPQNRYTASYNALVPRVPHSAWGGDFRKVNSPTVPDAFGARGSSLMKLLLAGHEKVSLTAEEFQRLATWMDTNALFYGTFDPADQARQQRGERIAGPKLQ